MDVRMAVVRKRTEILYQLNCEYQTKYLVALADRKEVTRYVANLITLTGLILFFLFFWVSYYPFIGYLLLLQLILISTFWQPIQVGDVTVSHGAREVGVFQKSLEDMNGDNVDRYEAELKVLEEFFGRVTK
jgi:hypothetical protein